LILEDNEKSQLDLVFLVNTSSFSDASADGLPPAFRRDINGNLVLASEENARATVRYNNCYVGDWSVHRGTATVYANVDSQQESLLAVNQLYATNGVDVPAGAAYSFLADYYKDQGRDTRIVRLCVDDQPFDKPAVNDPRSVEILVTPRFLYKNILESYSKRGTEVRLEVLKVIPFDELEQRSAALVAEKNDLSEQERQLIEDYKEAAKGSGAAVVGSLFVGSNTREKSFESDDTSNSGDGFYTQNACALQHDGESAYGVLGYRSLNGDMLSPGLAKAFQSYSEYTGKRFRWRREPGEAAFAVRFDTLDDAFRSILETNQQREWASSTAHCHVFIGFPADLVKLHRALAERGVRSRYGQLLPSVDLRERWASVNGFESFDEYSFASSFDQLTWGQLKRLRAQELNSPGSYQSLESEILRSGYASEESLSASLAIQYLDDRERGRKVGIGVIEAREQRLAEELERRRAVEERRKARGKEIARRYPFSALLSCEFQGRNVGLVACFAGGKYRPDTTLEVKNGEAYRRYQYHEIQAAGRLTQKGLVIDLRQRFAISAQNGSPNLLLTLTIRERATGSVVFERSVPQYGVLSASN